MYFNARVGAEKRQIPLDFLDITPLKLALEILAEKINKNHEDLAFATPLGTILTQTDMELTVVMIIEKYGNTLDVFEKGVLG